MSDGRTLHDARMDQLRADADSIYPADRVRQSLVQAWANNDALREQKTWAVGKMNEAENREQDAQAAIRAMISCLVDLQRENEILKANLMVRSTR